MIDLPPLQHWLVPIIRKAGLPGADDLSIPSDAPIGEAWTVAAMATGVTQEVLAEMVALHFGLGRVQFAETDVAAIPLLPARVARRLGVLCVGVSDRTVRVATADPVSIESENEIARLTSRSVSFEIATPEQVEDTLRAAYPETGDEAYQLPALLAEDEAPHILVVDDDANIRLLFRTVLQGKGFRVTEAEDGPEALDYLEANEGVHLVTLDLKMGEMDGLEVLERIRSRVRTHQLPVVVATGTSDPDVEMQLFEAGADDFVVKPIDPPRFLLRIQAVLRRHDRSGHPLLA